MSSASIFFYKSVLIPYASYNRDVRPMFSPKTREKRSDTSHKSQMRSTTARREAHTVYPRSEMFSRSSRYSEAQPEQAEAKRRSL